MPGIPVCCICINMLCIVVVVSLDSPEEFLFQLSEISHFPERMECLQLKKKSNEQLFDIGNQTIE